MNEFVKVIKNAKVVIGKEEEKHFKEGKTHLTKGSPLISKSLAWFTSTRLGHRFTSFKPIDSKLLIVPEKEIVFLSDFGFGKEENGTVNKDLYILKTPGHTDGSQTVIFKDHFAIVGDLMEYTNSTKVFTSFFNDEKVLLHSWKQLLDLGIKKFYPGHGKEISRELLKEVYNEKNN